MGLSRMVLSMVLMVLERLISVWNCLTLLIIWPKNSRSQSIIRKYIIKNNLVKDFSDFHEKVSGQKFVFIKSRETDKMLFCKIGNGTIAFDVIASTGTQSLKLLYFWLKRMGEASFVFIDKFDAFYHFKLAFEVCKQLFNLNCQVFTSSHNTYLMTNDLLRPDCNFILQDNKIKPLQACTEKELRFGHNIEKLFRAGAFEVWFLTTNYPNMSRQKIAKWPYSTPSPSSCLNTLGRRLLEERLLGPQNRTNMTNKEKDVEVVKSKYR